MKYRILNRLKVVLLTVLMAFCSFACSTGPTEAAGAMVDMTGSFSTTFQYTTVKWGKVSAASNYKVYIRFEGDKSYTLIAPKVKGTSYKDVYEQSPAWQAHKQFMKVNTGKAYICSDPSALFQMYRVKAFNAKGTCIGAVTIRKAAKPMITSIQSDGENAEIRFARVPWASDYLIYEKTEAGTYKRVAKTGQIEQGIDIVTVSVKSKATAFKVLAKVFGTHTSSADAISDAMAGKKILVLGDSTSYGKPYKTQDFAWPQRVALDTGADMNNASVSGCAFSIDVSDEKPGILTVAGGMDLSQYDVLFYTAGLNDHTKNVDMPTFNRACAAFLKQVKDASDQRVSQGKEPLHVIYVDIFYGTKYGKSISSVSRLERKNKAGYTGQDYINAMDVYIASYQKAGLDIRKYETKEIVNASNFRTATCESVHLTKIKTAEMGDKLSAIILQYQKQ